MERPTLDDAFEKLRWAKHHFEILKPQIEAFEQRDTHRISVNIDANAGKYVFSIHGLEDPDPDWGLIIGDCIHNARTALDYTFVRLWALATGEDPATIARKDIQFPIYTPDPNHPDGDEAATAARKQFASATGEMRKEPMFSGYLARVEELQPFNRWNPSIWGVSYRGHAIPQPAVLPSALGRLSQLDNVDKHRVPHAVWAAIDTFATQGISTIQPTDFKGGSGGTTYGPLKNDAEISTWEFQTPLPHEWNPSEVDMKGCFPLQVAFDQPSLFHGVLEVLPLCLWAVEAVLTIFRPAFEHPEPQPPLPVTAIEHPGP
jgi:hypothetical protein